MSLLFLFPSGAPPGAYTGTIYVNGVNDSANWQFTHLQAAISYMASNYPNLTADNGSGAAGPVHVEISLISTDTTAVVVSGFTTNAANYLYIYTTAEARPTAFLQSGKYQLNTANGNTLTLNTDFVRVDGLSINLTGANADFQSAIFSGVIGSPSDMRISNCFITAVGSTFRVPGILLQDSSTTVYIWNCAVIALGGAAHRFSTAFYLAVGTAYVYSCTGIGENHGVTMDNNNTYTLKNSYFYGVITDDITTAGNSPTVTQVTNATADTTATGTALDSIAYSTATFFNVTSGSEDFRPALGSALAGTAAGTDTSGESAPLNFTTDILGTTRTAWNVGAYMAGSTVYVDGVNNAPTRQFTTLQAAITYMVANYPVLTTNNGSGGAGPLHIEISVTGSEGQTIINGFTTSATCYVDIYTVAPARHAGVWSTSKYRIEAANTGALLIRDDHVRLDGLQINQTASNASFYGALIYSDGFISGTNEFRLSNCIVKATGSGFRVAAILLEDASITGMTIWNCIAIAQGGEDHQFSAGLAIAGLGASVYSCTLIGVGAGAATFAAAAVTIKNCYVAGTGSAATDFYVGGSGGTFTQTTCATADTSATGTALDSIPYSTATFTNVTAGSEDFHLPVGSALLDVGTDTSGESAPLNFTTDIAGTARTGTWEIGALLEEVVVAPSDIILYEGGLFRRLFARQFARVS